MNWRKPFGKQHVQILLLCLLFTVGIASLPAQTLNAGTGGFGSYDQITRSVIPVNTTGCSDVGVLLIGLSATGGNVYIGQIDIDLNNPGVDDTLGTSHIEDVKVYINIANKYDNTGIWTPINSSFSVAASTVTVTSTDANATIPSGADRNLWIAIDYNSTTLNDTPAKVSYFIDTIYYGGSAGGTGSTFDPAAAYGVDPTRTENINDYYVSISGAGAVANATENQGENDVVVLSLTFSGTVDDEAVDKEIAGITVQSVGDRDLDIGSPGVRLHWDANSNGLYDSGTDLQVATGMLSGGQAVLTTTPLDGNARFNAAAKNYLVVVNVDLNATIGNTIGLEISNPSTDITFRDALDDPGTYLSAESEYNQVGYITTDTITWTTNTFTVTPAPDLNPPQVLATNPLSGGTDVEPDTTISIVFSQYMLEEATGGGVLNPANYELRNIVTDTTIAVTPTYNSSAQTLTLTPAGNLDWASTYRLTLDQTIVDVDGQTLFDQYATDYQFTFVTRPEFPVVSEPTAIMNRIGTGTNSETVILIPTPPKGASEKISVQAFTTTGRLVKTFCKNVPYSAITDGRFIWDGTNDRGDPLGPGMYFVQVRTESYKRVLKVMIVR